MHRSRRATPLEGDWDRDWTSEASSGFALAGFLALVFVAITLLAMGPLAKFDTYFTLAPPPESWLPALYVLDRVGQRAVCLPILAVVAFVLCRKQSTLRPAVIAAASVFALNATVLVLKVTLGREGPYTVDPTFFNGGMAYPSGHSANIVLVYGLAAYLIGTYGSPSRRTRTLLWGAVVLLAGIMLVTSLTLDWHWFADLVAGLLVGAIVLQLTISVDHVVSPTALSRGRPAELSEKLRSLVLMKSDRGETT